MSTATLTRLDGLFAALRAEGYTVVGPRERSRAIVYAELAGADELATGWVDEADGGHYRLTQTGDGSLFRHATGPDSLKRFLFPPRVRTWRSSAGGELEVGEPAPRYAFVGVRACDLHAVAIQDRVFLEGGYVEPDYAARRQDAFFVAVNCTRAGGTCFCVSMDAGPRVERGHDVVLTELGDADGHRFLAAAGSERGAALLATLDHAPAAAEDLQAEQAALAATAASMGRRLDTAGLRELLQEHPEHPRWDAVAQRCLSCGNCTMVCPTCFCSTVEDATDLAGTTSERTRVSDSCFSLEHSYMHGGPVRRTTRSRYRQWMTHKLSTWIDQFGSAPRAASAAAAASRGARWRSTSPRRWRRSVRTLSELLDEVPVLGTLAPEHRAAIAGCARNRVFAPGEVLMREGAPADEFFVVRTGAVAIETEVPGRGAVTLETLHPGELLGWSWLVEPFRYDFTARALGTTHVVAMDGACLRAKSDADPALGYDLLKVLAAVFTQRLQHTRLRLLDLYGTHAR
jgi:ferredoxin